MHPLPDADPEVIAPYVVAAEVATAPLKKQSVESEWID